MIGELFITFGAAILSGIIFGNILNKLKIPAVAGYVIIGVILGPSVLNIFHENIIYSLDTLNYLALIFIAFIIGGELKIDKIKKLGISIMAIVLFEAFGAFFLVYASLFLFTGNMALSLILASIASATAPAATVMVIEQYKAKGTLTSTLLSVVAIDDGISLIIFSFAMAYAKLILVNATGVSIFSLIINPVMGIGLAIVISIVLSLVLVYFLIRISHKETKYIVIVGFIILLTGIAEQLHLSELIMSMVSGFIVVNFLNNRESNQVFSSIKEAAPPLFIAFFVTAGAHLNITMIYVTGAIGLIYFIARTAGKILGASFGAHISNAEPNVKKYIGFGLISQVGVAIGLTLFVTRDLSSIGYFGKHTASQVTNIVLATTLITEMVGPLLIKYALIKSGEASEVTKGAMV